jgi:peptidoglycan/xylan/chitin deacetylase (PgdA/CDA1 family)
MDSQWTVNTEFFSRQISFLKQNYTILEPKKLFSNISSYEKSVLITFDDGWKDNYNFAYPILKKHKTQALIFLITDFVDSHYLHFKDFLYMYSTIDNSNGKDNKKINESKKRLWINFLNAKIIRFFLSWNEIIEMENSGFCFGSHTPRHNTLESMTKQEILNCLVDSKEKISEKLKTEVTTFSYPDSISSKRLASLVKESGFLFGFTGPKFNDNELDTFQIPRLVINKYSSLNPWGNYSEAVFSHFLSDSFKILRMF